MDESSSDLTTFLFNTDANFDGEGDAFEKRDIGLQNAGGVFTFYTCKAGAP